MDTPDYAEALEAFRSWVPQHTEEGYRLRSMNRMVLWLPNEELTAHCLMTTGDQMKDHEAPNRLCQCGIYAGKRYTQIQAYTGLMWSIFMPVSQAPPQARVVGKVKLWGRVVVHELGLRGMFAYPSELFVLRTREAPVEEIEGDLAVYGVPISVLDPDHDEIKRALGCS